MTHSEITVHLADFETDFPRYMYRHVSTRSFTKILCPRNRSLRTSPRSPKQGRHVVNDSAFGAGGTSFPPGESLTVALDAGSSAIAAFGSVADNGSGDLTGAPALP